MKKEEYLIRDCQNGKEVYRMIKGYVKNVDGYFFGIDKRGDNNAWTITELSSGLKIDNCDKLSQVDDTIKKIIPTIQKYFTDRTQPHNLYYKYRDGRLECRNKWEEANCNPGLYWKVFGNTEEW